MRCYGDIQFQRPGSLANFRHLVLSCQRWKPASRAHTYTAWDLVKRLEVQEPATHRPPIPYGVVTAMISVAWMHKWFTWVGVTVLAFFGGGRLREILRCRRCDLILPSDTGEEGVFSCFLELQKFKSLFRQPAKIQHMRINDKIGVKVLEKIYGGMLGNQPLFFGTASQYRRRWDFLLTTFKISTSLRLTPWRTTRRFRSGLIQTRKADFPDPVGHEISPYGNAGVVFTGDWNSYYLQPTKCGKLRALDS